MVRNGSCQITRYYDWSTIFEIILSVTVLEWVVILVGCKIKGINKLEARESKNSLVSLNSHYNSRD